MTSRHPTVVEVVGSLAVGGAERVALEVAAGLADRGWDARLLIAGPADPDGAFERSIADEARARGVPVDHVPFRGATHPASARALASWLRRHRPGVVHVHNRPQDWQVAAVCKALRVPVIYTVHLPYTFDRRRDQLLYTALGRAVPAVVCVSRAVANHVRDSERIPPDKLRVIYNGIRMDVFRPPAAADRAAARAALGWGDGDFGWITAARLHSQKGHRFLLDAIARLPADSRARFALAGDGPLQAELEARAARLGIGDRVQFLGARRDVPALLGAADGYACTSMQEGHPLSLLEAMAVELPVVAPRLPSIEEIAMDGTPVLFGPRIDGWAEAHDPDAIAAALLQVERDAAEARRRARAARAHIAERYSREAMIGGHAALYERVAR